VTPPQATQASSPLLHQNPFTSGLSESLGDNSNISKELGGIQPKTIRRSLNWHNISVEAPSPSAGRSLPGGIQLQQEEASAVSGDRVSADSVQKSGLELSNSTISTSESAQKPLITRSPFNGRNIPIEAPARSSASSTYPGGIQRLETSGVKEQEESAESLQMQPLEEIQAKSSEGEPQEKEEQNKKVVQTKLTVGAPGDKHEQEADSMAGKVMAMPDSAFEQSIQPVKFAKKIGNKLGLGKDKKNKDVKPDEGTDRQKKERLEAAVNKVQQLMAAPGATVQSVKEKLPDIQSKYELKSLNLVKEKKGVYHVHGKVNPTLDGPPGVLFTAEELQELEAVAKDFSVQINQKEKEKPGTKAKFLADPEGFIRAGRVSKSGDVVEAAGTPGIEQLATAGGLTVVKNPYIQFVDAAGKHIGGRGPELDFLILGLSGLTEIVSAKLKPGEYKPKQDRKLLSHFVNMPLTPPDIVTYAQTNFGHNRAYANIAGAKVISNLGEESLSSFRANYLSKVVVDTITVTSLTPGPETSQGHQLRVTEPQLLTKVVELMRKYL